MISRLDSSSEQFLSALGVSTRKLNRAQLELTSGKRVNTVSDDPDQVSSLLQARADLGSTTQTKTNLGRVKTEVDTAESSIATAVSLVEHARVLGSQGATGTASANTRADIAGQLGDILNQLVAITNTTVEGRNIFKRRQRSIRSVFHRPLAACTHGNLPRNTSDPGHPASQRHVFCGIQDGPGPF